MVINLVLRLMYTYVALTLFDYFHILSDCNPVRIHRMQIKEMKRKKIWFSLKMAYYSCNGSNYNSKLIRSRVLWLQINDATKKNLSSCYVKIILYSCATIQPAKIHFISYNKTGNWRQHSKQIKYGKQVYLCHVWSAIYLTPTLYLWSRSQMPDNFKKSVHKIVIGFNNLIFSGRCHNLCIWKSTENWTHTQIKLKPYISLCNIYIFIHYNRCWKWPTTTKTCLTPQEKIINTVWSSCLETANASRLMKHELLDSRTANTTVAYTMIINHVCHTVLFNLLCYRCLKHGVM